jgi:glycosyltransferase involved in cell wall biosynthesis
MKPLVSILIPAYNVERWIADTIQSALAQTWQQKEIIIVDDGSTDRTLAIARQFASKSVLVVRQDNQGAAAARNKALSLGHGDYIQWLDADDLLAPDKIARQMDALAPVGSRRTLLSSSWGQFMYRPHRARFIPSVLWCDLAPAEFLVRKLGQRVFMQTAVWLVSRELTEAAGPWDTNMISDDDGEYFCRVLLNTDRIRFVPEAKVYYRVVGASSLSYVGRSEKKLEALWQSMRLHIRYLLSLEDSDRNRAACVKYLQNYLIVFYPLRLDIVEAMYQTAKDLGGRLDMPRLSWKYSWIKDLAGWAWAKRAQLLLPSVKWSLLRSWDKTLLDIETHGFLRGRVGNIKSVNPQNA